jgi:hypothetical protein
MTPPAQRALNSYIGKMSFNLRIVVFREAKVGDREAER